MATINGVEVAGDKFARDFGLLDDSDKTEIDNGIERNREAAEDNREDIVRHRTDTDVHVTPAWKNSLVTKEILGLYWTAAQTADIINEISIAGGAKLVKVEVLPAVGLEQTIYLVPKTDPQAGDVFDEYVWVDNKYEFIGTTKADISNVVKYTDYATSTRGGVFKFSQSHGITMSTDGFLMGSTRTVEQYASNSGNMLINKGTLENVFTYKGFASNADVVHIKGSDEVIDSKTFISLYTQSSGPSLWMKNTSFTMGTAPATNRYSGIWIQDSDGRDTAYIVHQANKNNSQNLKFSVSNADGDTVYQNALTFQGRLDGTFNFYSDNPANLGTSTNKWSDVRTEKVNGETVVTPTYLENKAEEWEFTLADGSTVTKKIVMA